MDNLRSGVLFIAGGIALIAFFWSGAAGAAVSDLAALIRGGPVSPASSAPAGAAPAVPAGAGSLA